MFSLCNIFTKFLVLHDTSFLNVYNDKSPKWQNNKNFQLSYVLRSAVEQLF